MMMGSQGGGKTYLKSKTDFPNKWYVGILHVKFAPVGGARRAIDGARKVVEGIQEIETMPGTIALLSQRGRCKRCHIKLRHCGGFESFM